MVQSPFANWRECHANEDALYRILRVLATVGVFRDAGPRMFANTPLSEAIRSDVADSARDTVLWESNPSHMRPFAELMHSI